MASFKLVLAFNVHIGHNYGQHSFMNVDSGYSVGHNIPPGVSGERATSTSTKVAGYHHSHWGSNAYLFAQHARSGSDNLTASTSPLSPRSRRSGQPQC